MPLAVRAFLCSFAPFAILLTGGSWAVQRAVTGVAQDALRASLRDHQVSMARMHARNERQGRRYLRIISENASLKAGLSLMMTEANDPDARRTVEDQLSALCAAAGIDLLVVSSLDGAPMAGVIRIHGQVEPLDAGTVQPPPGGFFSHRGATYQISSVPVDQGEENVALLSVGERVDLKELNTPAVLLWNGRIVESSVSGVTSEGLERALSACGAASECELRMNGGNYLSMAAETSAMGGGYSLRSLVGLDASLQPVQSVLRMIFTTAAAVALLAAVIVTLVSSRSIVNPIAKVVARLRESERTGTLTEFGSSLASVREIRELTDGFNRAAAAIRKGHTDLHRAYAEFVSSLANALDARDSCTAGHSSRVSRLSCVLARAMNVGEEELEILRIGALLHDIGKIGVPDAVLQKPGRLTEEEFGFIKRHPALGRRILEGVDGFAPYLEVVELHHENWDGTGYPYGLRGGQVPLTARIVHVVDAYDAMTSDRPYRSGMSTGTALRILQENAGTQFDPDAVRVFVDLMQREAAGQPGNGPGAVWQESLPNLAAALGKSGRVAVVSIGEGQC